MSEHTNTVDHQSNTSGKHGPMTIDQIIEFWEDKPQDEAMKYYNANGMGYTVSVQYELLLIIKYYFHVNFTMKQ